MREVEKRILQYIDNAESIHSLPIAEALVTFKTVDGDSLQEFIPFINEVRLGSTDAPAVSDYTSENENSGHFPKEPMIGSERHNSTMQNVSPRNEHSENRVTSASVTGQDKETLDLAVDYWPTFGVSQSMKKEEKRPEINKLSIKSTFCTLCVSRLPAYHDDMSGLLFTANMKNRNKGVKRLMKQKEKDLEEVSAVVRKLVCTVRTSGNTFTVHVDGRELNNVKFFSLSSLWPTHIKQFPIGMFLNYGYS